MTKQALLRRWNELWDACGVRKGGRGGHFDRLYVKYREPGRGYHGIAHIEHGLRVFDRFKHLAKLPQSVEAAWWGHDVIIGADKPELESARYMDAVYQSLGLVSTFRTAAFGCTLATTHDTEETDRDRQLICDIDRSPMGGPWHMFVRDTIGLRKEAAHRPKCKYIADSRTYLGNVLRRKHIFYLPEFRDSFEAQARDNIAHAIEELPKIIATVP